MQTSLDQMISPSGKVMKQPHPDRYSRYWVTRDGELWSSRSRTRERWLLMKDRLDGAGRHVVVLSNGMKRGAPAKISRLVALAWCDNPDNLPFVLHRDDDTENNTVGNLYWGTPQQNADDRTRNGMTTNGESHWKAKLNEEDVRNIRILTLTDSYSCRHLARLYGVSGVQISNVITGKSWAHLPLNPLE